MGHACVDLNADLGEGFPWDGPLLERVTSASVACGAHAGDEAAICATLVQVARARVVLGAHPGYPDRVHFGRRPLDLDPGALRASIAGQVAYLDQLASARGLSLAYVKPHGALYNQAQVDPRIATVVVDVVEPLGLALLGLPGGALARAAAARGVRFWTEGFLDRRYAADGTLVPRSRPDALLTDRAEIEAQLLRLVDTGVDSLCVHGDRPDALDLADRAIACLDRHGVCLRAPGP